MKKILLLACFMAFSHTSQAQSNDKELQQNPTNKVTVTPQQISIQNLERRYTMVRDEFYNFVGAYELSNGSSITLYTKGNFNIMYAQLDDHDPRRVYAINNHTFVAVDRSLEISIKHLRYDEVGGYVLMNMGILNAKLDGPSEQGLLIAQFK
jgi:hypothetical protein